MPKDLITVAIVEDEMILREELSFQLAHLGFEVHAFENAEQFYRYLAVHPETMVVLDIGLTGEDGLSICRHLRSANAEMGIVFVTARSLREDRLIGLQAGVDAYLTKPVDIVELVLILRRLSLRLLKVSTDTQNRRPSSASPSLTVAATSSQAESAPPPAWKMEAESSFVIAPNGVRIRLSVNEAQLLRVLLKQAGAICSHMELGMALGLTVDEIDKHRIEVILSRLRSKAARSAGVALAIVSERGIGYSLQA